MTLQTLTEAFFNQCKTEPKVRALTFYAEGRWQHRDWSQYEEEVRKMASWLRDKGVKPGVKVGLLSGNRPEWVMADLAIMSLGGISIPIYATSAPRDVNYILEHSEAEVLCIDTWDRFKKANVENVPANVLVFDDLPPLTNKAAGTNVFAWPAIRKDMAADQQVPVACADEDIATIIYTSGTTGMPKGVVHTHGNLKYASKPVVQVLEEDRTSRDRFFSFLPLSHVAERVLVELGSIYTGAEVAFARGIETLTDDLVVCRPSILLCVPRLWEKIYEKISNGLLSASAVKKTVFSTAKSLGSIRIDGNIIYKDREGSWQAKISDALVGKKLKTRLGMDNVRMYLTGSAPTRKDVMEFFASFGIVITEVYGLTENLCLGVHNPLQYSVIGRCGKPFSGNEIKIASDEEILFKAPWMFKEYYKNPEATAEVMDADGWFHTGDLGELDDKGFLRISGRKKELIKTSGGKYVAPVPIEDKLKILPYIGDAMVVGDNYKFCIAILSLDPEAMAGKNVDEVQESIVKHLDEINQQLASFESIKRVGILKNGFSVEDGTLTPSLKVKRKEVSKQHGTFIESVYSASKQVVVQ